MTKKACDLWDKVAETAKDLRRLSDDIPSYVKEYYVTQYRRAKMAFNNETESNLPLNW